MRLRTCRYREDEFGADAVFRVTSRDVLRELWSRTSEDWAVALACAPWDADPDALIAVDVYDDDGLRAFAGTFGWVYQHRYGGGADEQYARFVARDPQLSDAVRRHAEERVRSTPAGEQWWMVGRPR